MIANSRQAVSAGYTKLSPIMRKIELKIEAKKPILNDIRLLYFLFILCLIINVVLKVLGLHVD